MKYFASALALAGLASAHSGFEAEIAFDCYYECERTMGDWATSKDTKVSDLLTMTGLDANSHELTQITACRNERTGLISGITSSWAKWSGGEPTDIKRLNLIGKMHGLHHFDNGLSVSADNEIILEEYWYQEADLS